MTQQLGSDIYSHSPIKMRREQSQVEMFSEVWIGMAEIKTTKNNDLHGEISGGYMQVAAIADDAREYRVLVANYLGWLDFEIVDLSEIEPLTTRLINHEIDTVLSENLNEIGNEHDVAIGTLNTFSN